MVQQLCEGARGRPTFLRNDQFQGQDFPNHANTMLLRFGRHSSVQAFCRAHSSRVLIKDVERRRGDLTVLVNFHVLIYKYTHALLRLFGHMSVYRVG